MVKLPHSAAAAAAACRLHRPGTEDASAFRPVSDTATTPDTCTSKSHLNRYTERAAHTQKLRRYRYSPQAAGRHMHSLDTISYRCIQA